MNGEVTAGDLAVGALTRISRLRYFYEDLAEGAVDSEINGRCVASEVRAEAIEMTKRGIRNMFDLIDAKNNGER